MRIKLDIDNHQFAKWLRLFRFRYSFIIERKNFKISYAEVYRTKKGFHIYLFSNINELNTILLLECLFGSDLNKQLFGYGENADILFKNKFNGKSKEKYDAKKSAKLRTEIQLLNKNTIRIKKFKVKF